MNNYSLNNFTAQWTEGWMRIKMTLQYTSYFPKMKLTGATDIERNAVCWARASYGRRWKQRLRTRPETLPIWARHFWRYPFGIPEWNELTHIARGYLWRVENLGQLPID